jgi:hypothetical protein
MPTVQQFADARSCSTSGLRPLTNQILEVLLNSINVPEEPSLVRCDDIPLLRMVGGSTIPMLQPAARASLQRVIEQKDRELQLVHAYRTIAQQYVLKEWVGKCQSITAARRPGTSDHEGGLAIDINEFSVWKNTLVNNGWVWAGMGDKGHFRFAGANVDRTVITESVRAFQILWNRNNPNDLIDEDGVYGEEQTAPALRISPIGGFPTVL